MKKRILGLVDAENLYRTPKKLWGQSAKVDFQKLFNLIVEKSTDDAQVRIYVVADPLIDQTAFLRVLSKIGYDIRLKTLHPQQGQIKNSNWDPEMIQDALSVIQDIDKLILVSGDGDFAELIETYKKNGKETQVICFEDNSSPLLSIADSICYLDQRILWKFREEKTYSKMPATPQYKHSRPTPGSQCRFPMQ